MKKVLLILSVCLSGLVTNAQSLQEKLNELLGAYARLYKFNGSILVAQKGEILLERGYGLKNAALAERDGDGTIYQVGSVTKQFTSAVILKLQEQKKLSVQDKLSKYFPDFKNGDKITIENLLTHTSGIYNYTNDEKFMKDEITHSFSMDQMVALFKDKPLDFEPGTKWSYSNSGYCLLGYIIEKVTKKPYEQVVHEMILGPLHMDHSGFDFTHLKSTDKATGYLELDASARTIAPIVDSSVSYAAGALYSTVEDLYKWDRSLYGNAVLSPASLKAAFTPFKNKYGYGWGIDTLFNRPVTSHGGGIHGFTSNMFRMPQDQIVIIMLNNKNNPHLSEITKSIAAILLNQKYEVPKDTSAAVTLPAELLQTYVGEYQLSPEFIITIVLDKGALKAQATGQPSVDLFARTNTLFFIKVVDAELEFVKGENGKIDHMILHQNGSDVEAKKIK